MAKINYFLTIKDLDKGWKRWFYSIKKQKTARQNFPLWSLRLLRGMLTKSNLLKNSHRKGETKFFALLRNFILNGTWEFQRFVKRMFMRKPSEVPRLGSKRSSSYCWTFSVHEFSNYTNLFSLEISLQENILCERLFSFLFPFFYMSLYYFLPIYSTPHFIFACCLFVLTFSHISYVFE